MTVNSLKAGYSTYSSSSQDNASERQSSQRSFNASVKTDRVTISDEAKKLLNEADASQMQNTQKLPAEAYALPSWYNDYLMPANVPGGIDYDFWNYVGTLTNDNKLSDGEKQQIISYLQNDSSYQQTSDNEDFTSYKGEIENYISKLHGYFQSSLQENGVNSTQDYYDKVILDQNSSEKIHQSMVNKIQNDPTMQNLINVLGIKAQ